MKKIVAFLALLATSVIAQPQTFTVDCVALEKQTAGHLWIVVFASQGDEASQFACRTKHDMVRIIKLLLPWRDWVAAYGPDGDMMTVPQSKKIKEEVKQ